jgi:hypothetical protein
MVLLLLIMDGWDFRPDGEYTCFVPDAPEPESTYIDHRIAIAQQLGGRITD